jgi:hypothetical protein
MAHHVQAINRSHFGMIKFGRRDQEYHIVLGFLLDFADSATEVVRKRFGEVAGEAAVISVASLVQTER